MWSIGSFCGGAPLLRGHGFNFGPGNGALVGQDLAEPIDNRIQNLLR